MKKFIIVFFLFLSFVWFSPTSYAQASKKITVDLTQQKLFAWEGDSVVFQTAISGGLPQTPTVKGTFAIGAKYSSQTMSGGSRTYGYYNLPNVPHVMYFHQAYAIHGAYWHNNFGTPRSHGCVNVPLDAAAWLYNWAPSGTHVQIY